jgi:hypothetical protein
VQSHTRDETCMKSQNIVYVNNIAAALFGMGKYDECAAKAQEAVNIGKEHRYAIVRAFRPKVYVS